MKKWLRYIGIAVVALIVFGFIAKSLGWIGKKKLPKVAIEQAEVREVIGIVSATGKIYPDKEVVISPEVPGEIIDIYVEEGDSVVEGQLLAKIRADDYETAIERNISNLNNAKAGIEQADASIAQARANLAQAKARATQAQAQLNNAQAELERNRKLFDQQLISQREYQNAQLQVNTAAADYDAAASSVASAQETVNSSIANKKASQFTSRGIGLDVQQARTSYNKTLIRAPQNGIISELNVEKGERVVGTSQMAGTDMMTIADLKNMECRIEVSENDIVQVTIGDSCNIEVDAYYDRNFKGIVSKISNSLSASGNNAASVLNNDQVTNFLVTVKILPESYAELKDKRFPFRPGMSASVDIITDKVKDKVTTPIISVFAKSRDDYKKMIGDSSLPGGKELREFVYRVNGNHTLITPVKTGIDDSEYYVIEEGLNKGDSVIVAPYEAIQEQLTNDEKVDIVPKDKVYESDKKKKK